MIIPASVTVMGHLLYHKGVFLLVLLLLSMVSSISLLLCLTYCG